MDPASEGQRRHTHCDLLARAVPVDGEEGVGGRCVQGGSLGACQEAVDGQLQWLELGRVLLLHQLIQEGLVLLLQQKCTNHELQAQSAKPAFSISLLQYYLKS